jgi:hypothetical protein
LYALFISFPRATCPARLILLDLIILTRHQMEVSGQLHAPAALPPGKEPPGSHWIGGWVDPRAVLDAVVKRKIPSPGRESNPRTPIVQPVAQSHTDWAITALSFTNHSHSKYKLPLINTLHFHTNDTANVRRPANCHSWGPQFDNHLT